MSALYVYALLPEDERPGGEGRGVAGEPVRLLRVGGLAAAVGEVAGPPPVDLASLSAHDAVVRRLAGGARSLLPLRFGQVVEGERTLGERIADSLPRLRAALLEVEGCEQTTWRVYGPREGPAPEPGAAEPAPGTGPGTRYLARRARAHAPPAAIAAALARVAPLVRAERVQRHDAGPLVANVYHLVRRVDRERYARGLAEALEALRGIRVQASGPWPPYAFAGRWPA